MTTTDQTQDISTINIVREVLISASAQITFDSVLEEMGPGSQLPDGKPFHMKIEAWPGGRWFRDLGNNTGHLWGHVQVIKPPTLLEISGPFMMSYPAVNFVQYRLTPEGTKTRLKITHQAMGMILDEHKTGMVEGWDHGLKRIREIAEGKPKR